MRNTFREVLDILKIHGHEIMMALYGDECKRALRLDFTPEEWEIEEKSLMFYSCYEGGDFFPILFGLKNYDRRTIFDDRPEVSVANLKRNYIYHCEINTYVESKDYGSTQVHYFTVLHSDDATILLQTYGGTDGILVKYVYADINIVLSDIIGGSSETYRRLFEIPKYMEHVLTFNQATLKYVGQSLFIPDLKFLNSILQPAGLDFAAKKLGYLV